MSITNSAEYDEILTQIAGRAGGLQPLFAAFFGFLHRRTDFYVVFDSEQLTESATMGFAKGVAKKMLLQAFEAFPMKSYIEEKNKLSAGNIKKQARNGGTATSSSSSSALTTSSSSSSQKDKNNTGAKTTTPPPPVVEKKDDEGSSTTPTDMTGGVSTGGQAVTEEVVERGAGEESGESQGQAHVPQQQQQQQQQGLSSQPNQETGLQVPIGNGGVGPGYYWTQSLKEATVYVDAPRGCRGKDVKYTLRPTSLNVEAQGQVLISGNFEFPVKVEDSMWTINIASANSHSDSHSREEGKQTDFPQIVINLEKAVHTWWKFVIDGHPQIDTSKVDSTQKIDEYDDGTQAELRKIVAQQRDKMRGLPGRHENPLTPPFPPFDDAVDNT